MKCLTCGNDLPENAKFCNSCGARVIKNDGGVGIKNNSLGDVSNLNLENNIEINSNKSLDNNDSINTDNTIVNNNLNQDNNLSSFNALNNDSNLVDVNNINFVNSSKSSNSEQLTNSDAIINSNNFQNKNKKGKKIVLLVIILLIIALIASALIYFFIPKTNPKQIFVNGMKEITSKLFVTNDKSEYTSITTDFDIKSNITTDDTSLASIFNITNKLGLKGSMNIDYKNKIINGDFKINYDSDQLTDIVVYGEKNNIYLYLDGLYDKYISVPIDSYEQLFNSNPTELSNIKKGFDNAFEIALKDEYLSTKKETITIKGNNKKVTSNILTIDSSNVKDFYKDFTQSLISDSNFISSMAKLSNISENELKELLSSYDELDLDNNEKMVITIYTDRKNDFVGIKFNFIDDSANSVINIYQLDELNYIAEIEENNQKYLFNLNIKVANDTKTYTLSSNIDSSKIEITLSSKTNYNNKVNILDVQNNVNYEQISIDDINKIQQKLMQNSTFMKLLQDINKISSNDLSSIY